MHNLGLCNTTVVKMLRPGGCLVPLICILKTNMTLYLPWKLFKMSLFPDVTLDSSVWEALQPYTLPLTILFGDNALLTASNSDPVAWI